MTLYSCFCMLFSGLFGSFLVFFSLFWSFRHLNAPRFPYEMQSVQKSLVHLGIEKEYDYTITQCCNQDFFSRPSRGQSICCNASRRGQGISFFKRRGQGEAQACFLRPRQGKAFFPRPRRDQGISPETKARRGIFPEAKARRGFFFRGQHEEKVFFSGAKAR